MISGTISIGEVQAIFQYINQISEPVTEMSYTLNSLQAAIASVERVYQIEDELEELPDATNEVLLPTLGEMFLLSRYGLDTAMTKS